MKNHTTVAPRIASSAIEGVKLVTTDPWIRALLVRAAPMPSPCWLLDPSTSDAWIKPDGYSGLRVNGRQDMGHRVVHERLVGPIPDGLVIDHLCHDAAAEDGHCAGGPCIHRRCVNPAHLAVVTLGENTMASPLSITARNAAKTRCDRGHEFSPENTYWTPTGRRGCRMCRRGAQARWRNGGVR